MGHTSGGEDVALCPMVLSRALAPPPGHRRIGVFLALVLVALSGCGGPRGVTLTELAANPEYYDGRTVIAHGVVLEFGDDEGSVERHYVLQDADVNRVELLPPDRAEPHVGSAVEVLGEFAYDENRGRMLHIDTIEAVTAAR